MLKSEMIKLFGSTQEDAAKGLGITRCNISKWPEVLTWSQEQKVREALIRLNSKLPDNLDRRKQEIKSVPEKPDDSFEKVTNEIIAVFQYCITSYIVS